MSITLLGVGGGSGAYNPLLFPGGKYLFEPSYDLTKYYQDSGKSTLVSADGDPIGNAVDLFGTGREMTASGGDRPIYKTGIINGKAAALFSTVSFMEMASNLFAYTGGGYISFVIKLTTITGSYQRILSTRTATDYDYNTNDGIILARSPNPAEGFIHQTESARADGLTIQNPNPVDGNSYYTRFKFTGGNASATVTGLGTVTDTYTNFDPFPDAWMDFGAQHVSGGWAQEFYEGYIARVLIATGNPSASALANDDAYVLSTYGLA